ncbi:MAG: carbonic anhydrase family protein [Acidimicrobiales bacterium]|nr:carbonic anhydrase family protein [Acidimicrobiales bacterium]
MRPVRRRVDVCEVKSRVRRAVLAASVLSLAACGPFGGGGDEAKDTSTRPDAPEEQARVPVPSGGSLPHWTYEGEEGPELWGELAEDWSLCSTGDEQSPIDITEGVPFVAAAPTTTTIAEETTTTTAKKAARTTTTETTVPQETTTTEAPFPGAPAEQVIDFRYHLSAYTVVDNGHTVQVNLDDAGAMVIDGVPFTLVQFHFHAPSEHLLAGAAYPVEYHLVHKSEAGELAVVGVLIQRGAENETLKPIFDELPSAGETIEGEEPIDPLELLPANRTMVRYNGSLTTPPCTEHVRWHLMLTPLQMSKLQVARFMAKHPDSRRPVQEQGDREVVVEVDDVTDVEGADTADDHGADAGASHDQPADASHDDPADASHDQPADASHDEPATATTAGH